MALDLCPKVMEDGKAWRFLGVYSKNRVEWGLSHLANMHMGATTVALYDTLGVDALKYVINQTELTTIVCQGDLVKKLIDYKLEELNQPENERKLHRLVNIVTMDDVPKEHLTDIYQAQITIHHFDDLCKKGANIHDFKVTVPGPHDVIQLSYTSGTTGDPKGVIITHRCILSANESCQIRFRQSGKPLDEHDCYVSYLPAAHIFEATLFTFALTGGVRCGYYGGDMTKLISHDLPMLKPTYFPSVPRLWNRLYAIIKSKMAAETGCKAWLINRAVQYKLANLNATGEYADGCYDALVFNKIKQVLGGNVQFMLTASAPLSADVMQFMKICFSSRFFEAYGMTETCGGAFCTYGSDPISGHVGGPVANTKMRLRDIPEMDYYHTNTPPKGEICFWGPSTTKGYFRNPEKTAESFHNGWLKSGDVGIVHPNGTVQVVDRVKNLFKLSQGEYISPEKLEQQYVKSEFLAQVWIHGTSIKDWIVIFAVVEPARVKKWAEQAGK